MLKAPLLVASLALFVATTAYADDPTLHPEDGLPPIGDIGGGHGGTTEKSCTETYESLSLTLEQVTVDGAPAPLATNAQSKDITSDTLLETHLGATSTGGVSLHVDYTTSIGRPYYFYESYDAAK